MNKVIFEDLPSTNTPINANNLNQVQTNVENAINYAEEITSVGSYISRRKVGTDEEVWVNMSGVDITIPQGWGGYTVGTLPEGHRPKRNIDKAIVGRLKSNISSTVMLMISYSTNGTIKFLNLGNSEVTIQYLGDYEKYSLL